MYTKQQTFDMVVGGILAQGELAIGPKGCRYRIEKDGKMLKCAAGQLIPDDKYNPCWDEPDSQGAVTTVKEGNPIAQVLEEEGHDSMFVATLQSIHDESDTIPYFVHLLNDHLEYLEVEWNFDV